jgi:ribonuclease HII
MLKLKFSDHKIECGTDEAGRGCLAGPVTAAAVILKKNFLNNDIDDSKKISKKNRYKLKDIIEKEALEFSFTHIFPKKLMKSIF